MQLLSDSHEIAQLPKLNRCLHEQILPRPDATLGAYQAPPAQRHRAGHERLRPRASPENERQNTSCPRNRKGVGVKAAHTGLVVIGHGAHCWHKLATGLAP
jgi:hypothetical protein